MFPNKTSDLENYKGTGWNTGEIIEEVKRRILDKRNDLEQKQRETDNEMTTNRLGNNYLGVKCQGVKCLAMILEDQQPEH